MPFRNSIFFLQFPIHFRKIKGICGNVKQCYFHFILSLFTFFMVYIFHSFIKRIFPQNHKLNLIQILFHFSFYLNPFRKKEKRLTTKITLNLFQFVYMFIYIYVNFISKFKKRLNLISLLLYIFKLI